MIKRRERLSADQVVIFLVAYDEPTLLHAKILQGLELPGQLLIDRTKQSYARWGLERTSLSRSMLSPTLSWRYLKLLLKGERFLGLAPDMFQLGGDFVIDSNGVVAFAHRMRHNGDRVDAATLFDALTRVVAGGGT